MAVFNEPTQWEHPLGNHADTSTLPDDAAATVGIASLQKLFQIINATPLEAGGIAPDRGDVNALFKYLGDQIFYTQNGGIPSYNAAYDYIAGRVVLYNGNLYKCIQANGASSTVVAPDSDTAYWQRLDNYVRSVNGVNADAQGNVSDIVESGPGYIRYANGVQICWGEVPRWTLTWADHQSNYNLPKPFKDTNYTVQTTPKGLGEDFLHIEVKPADTPYFHCSFIPFIAYMNGTIRVVWDDYSSPWISLYLAVGYWK